MTRVSVGWVPLEQLNVNASNVVRVLLAHGLTGYIAIWWIERVV